MIGSKMDRRKEMRVVIRARLKTLGFPAAEITTLARQTCQTLGHVNDITDTFMRNNIDTVKFLEMIIPFLDHAIDNEPN